MPVVTPAAQITLTGYRSGVLPLLLKTFRANTWGVYVGFQNGTTTSATYNGAANSVANRSADWNKFCITNAEYYYQSSGTAGTGFSGIQIK